MSRQEKGRSTAWRWQVKCRQAAAVIRLLHPYLITKAEEADVAIAFDGLPTVTSTKGKSGTPRVPDELLARRQQLFAQIRDLKPTAGFRLAKEI
jgi:hypothetical protein